MDEVDKKGPEGLANESIVFEAIGEGNVCEYIGEFSLADFMGEIENIPDDNADGIPNDANVSSPGPSGIEKNKWKDELKEEEFVFQSREDLRDFVESTRNPNTVRKTNQVVSAFQKWLQTYCNKERAIEMTEPAELDSFLSNYLLTKKPKKGGEHQPDTLTSIHRAIIGHLKHKEYAVDALCDEAYEMSRDVLNSRRTKLKQEGLGNRPNKAESFDEEEIKKMWDTRALGTSDPTTLQHTLYWYFTIGFGLRGCDENRKMQWGDVALLQDKDGEDYLQWTERSSKTRQGGEGGHIRPFAPKIYAKKNDTCPVQIYKEFASKRPQRAMVAEAPFHLTVHHGAMMNDSVCYINAPMGVNELRDVVKTMCEKSGIPGRHTNHSLRKTACLTLMANNIPPVLVAQLSGHKNLNNLNNYSVATRPQKCAMSHILTGFKRKPEPTSLVHDPHKSIAPATATTVNDPTSHGNMLLPPAPVAFSLPRPHPMYLPVNAANNQPDPGFQRLAENASAMFTGTYVNSPINLHFNYNVQANSHSQVNVSPKLPSVVNPE